MSEREAFLRRFHAARPGITSSSLGRDSRDTPGRRDHPDSPDSPDSYDRLAAAVPPGARVLDLGCGDTHLLSRLGPRAIGLDLAPSRGPHAGAAMIVQGRAQALPFADRSFDACVCHLAFMLFDDISRVVGEVRRVVVPGGMFAAVLGGGPTASDAGGDDAFHRFLAIGEARSWGVGTPTALPGGRGFGDRRARTCAGWRELFGTAPEFERLELDLSGAFDDVWRFLGASYQLPAAAAPAIRSRLEASYAGRAAIPCRVVVWLATIRL